MYLKFIITNLENLAIRNLIFQKIPIIERKNDIFKVHSRKKIYDKRVKRIITGKDLNMKTLYLHIGTPKTATSSIQKFLKENWDVLQKHGYFFPESLHMYPGVNARRNAHFLVGKVQNEKGERDKKKETIYLKEGLQQIRDAFENYDHVILTDESIWYCLSYGKKSLLYDLKKEADEQNYQIKVIVYLRRQDKFLLSRWNQSVKQRTSHVSQMPCDQYLKMTQEKNEKIYQYDKKLDEIAKVIGKENLIVRRFVPESWRDGSIIHDFMHEIGMDVTSEFQELEENVNLRLDKNTTEIKRILNQESEFSEKEISYMGKYLKEISKTYIEKDTTEMLSKEELQQFLKKYEEGNYRVAEKYMKEEGPLFSDKIKDLPKWSPQNEGMLEEVILFFSKFMIDLKRTNDLQKNQIKDLKTELRKTETEFKVFQNKVRHPFRTILKRIFR